MAPLPRQLLPEAAPTPVVSDSHNFIIFVSSYVFLVTSKIVTIFPPRSSSPSLFPLWTICLESLLGQYLDHTWPHAFFPDTTQASSGYRNIWCDIDNADNWLTASWSPKVRIVQPLFASSQKYLRSVFVNIWAQNNSWSGFCHLEAFFRWNYLSIQSIRLDKTNCHCLIMVINISLIMSPTRVSTKII